MFPSYSPSESSIEFEIETYRSLHLDMRDINLSLKLQMIKGSLFAAFKKQKSEKKAKSKDNLNEEPELHLTYVNFLLQYLFSNFEDYFNNTMADYANGLYPDKAKISN